MLEDKEQCKECFHYQVCANVLKQQLFIREVMLKEEKPKCEHYKPTDDVEEVKHGRWQIEDRGGKPTERPICSQCGATPKYYVNGKSSPYCQECGSKMNINVVPYRGAKMDGKDKNVPANGRSYK